MKGESFAVTARYVDASAPALRGLAVVCLVALGACKPRQETSSSPREASAAPGDGTLVEQIGSGVKFTCARMNDGAVRCWGDVPWESDARLSPVPVAGLATAREISVGDYAICAVLGDATVACVGPMRPRVFGDARGQDAAARPVPLLTGVAHVAVGRTFACAALANGSVSCWGANDDGQLGEPRSDGHALPAPVPGLGDVREILADYQTVVARLADGSSRIWGHRDDWSSYGERWQGIEDPTPGRSGLDFVSLSPLCATLAGNDVSCGVDTSTPFTPPGLAGLTRVAGARGELCGVASDGTVRCVQRSSQQWPQTAVRAFGEIRQLAISDDHQCALLADGHVRCWGANDVGQLGDGTLCESREEPTGPIDFSGPAAGECVPRGVLEQGTVGETDPPSDLSFALTAPGHVSTWRIDVAKGEMIRTSGRPAGEEPPQGPPFMTSAAADTTVAVDEKGVAVCRDAACTTVRPSPSPQSIASAHLSADAKTLVILRGSEHETAVEFYDVATSRRFRVMRNLTTGDQSPGGWATRFVGNTFMLATCIEPSGFCVGHLYDPRSGASLGATKGNPWGGRELYVSGSLWVFVSNGTDPRIDLVDVRTGRNVAEIALPWQRDFQVPLRAFLQDASTLVVMAEGNSAMTATAAVIDLSTQKVVKTFSPPSCGPACAQR
jgi:alpha-tubulin suppressor-like RCC1 family protein